LDQVLFIKLVAPQAQGKPRVRVGLPATGQWPHLQRASKSRLGNQVLDELSQLEQSQQLKLLRSGWAEKKLFRCEPPSARQPARRAPKECHSFPRECGKPLTTIGTIKIIRFILLMLIIWL
jgi:hypothetical protein